MKKILLSLAAVMLVLGSLPSARAADIYTCQLEGEISGLRLGFIFGGQALGGTGEIYCEKNNQRRSGVSVPVELRLVGGGLGFDFTVVRSIHVLSAGVGVADPYALTGSFNVGATTGATLIHQGISADAAVKLTGRGLGFEVGFLGEDAIGLGVRLHGLVFTVRPI